MNFTDGFMGNCKLFYTNKETGETKPLNIETAKIKDVTDPLNDDYYEDTNKIVAKIPSDMEFTISIKQTHKQSRTTRKYCNSIFNNYKRRIRSYHRIKERLRRAKLKSKEYIKMSPRIAKRLQVRSVII